MVPGNVALRVYVEQFPTTDYDDRTVAYSTSVAGRDEAVVPDLTGRFAVGRDFEPADCPINFKAVVR